MNRDAQISPCGRYRWTLTRHWDARPRLLVVMFNPSTADAQLDDPTISLLCWLATYNGFGSVTVMNLVPVRSSSPDAAVQMVAAAANVGEAQSALRLNEKQVLSQVWAHGAVLLAWGALVEKIPHHAAEVLAKIESLALELKVPVYCLGKTANGHPKHPLARGRHKVRKDQRFIAWRA